MFQVLCCIFVLIINEDFYGFFEIYSCLHQIEYLLEVEDSLVTFLSVYYYANNLYTFIKVAVKSIQFLTLVSNRVLIKSKEHELSPF